MKGVKYLEKIKIVPSDLNLGGSPGSDQNSDLESEMELELDGSKPNMGS